ncbi:MAG TPA: restriction endonuclease [Bryobacteraceae bacterium]|nr:restriction endonuclease [Bryobacteraceae bacterium]
MRKNELTTEVSHLRVHYSVRGVASYSIEVLHQGLHKHRLIRGPDSDVIEAKVRLQVAEWDAAWAKKVAADEQVTMAYRAKETAAEKTAEAQATMHALGEVLVSSLADSKVVDFEKLKDRAPFPKAKPAAPKRPAVPEQPPIPEAPFRTAARYWVELRLIDKLIKSRRLEKQNVKAALFEADMKLWEANREHILSEHAAKLEQHRQQLADLEAAYGQAVKDWEAERSAFLAKQAQQHGAIDAFRTRYEAKDPAAITEYCDVVLANSEYPDCLPKEFELDLNVETGVLVVNYKLPAPADLPTVSEVKYVQASDRFTEKHLSEASIAKMYDDLIYQIALRTLNELLEADQALAFASVVFNGFVTAVDKGTGNETTGCIISIQATKEALRTINLSKVDPKACFRQLKGVGSSKLHSITPVAPIVNLRRDDERFIPSYGVADRLNEGFNLAAMDWEDFEHLIREIFEKEFTSSGGEVRVTQASRDGGVDAVAFDPDPIRGGKIVIQAKRYAHTVGVSAVRDLYGTLMNEGATKGILVTTSDYGPDAYEFANGKPITLLNGANLLHLLEKHGTKAHINLVEARQLGIGRSTATN